MKKEFKLYTDHEEINATIPSIIYETTGNAKKKGGNKGIPIELESAIACITLSYNERVGSVYLSFSIIVDSSYIPQAIFFSPKFHSSHIAKTYSDLNLIGQTEIR